MLENVDAEISRNKEIIGGKMPGEERYQGDAYQSSGSSSEGEQVGANKRSVDAPPLKSVGKVLTAPSPSSKKRQAFGDRSATEDSALAVSALKGKEIEEIAQKQAKDIVKARMKELTVKMQESQEQQDDIMDQVDKANKDNRDLKRKTVKIEESL